MAIQDNYTLLSKAVQIANGNRLSCIARLKSIACLIKKSFRLNSVHIYLPDPERHSLSGMITTDGSAKVLPCFIPMGDQGAGMCAFRKEIVFAPEEAVSEDTAEVGVLPPRESLFLPIMSGKRIAGVLSLRQKTGSPPIDPVPPVLQEILLVMAGLIRTDEIVHLSDQRIKNFLLLNDLGNLFHSRVSSKGFFSFILKAVHRSSCASCTILRIFDRQGFAARLMKKCKKTFRPHLESLLEIETRSTAGMLATGTPRLTVDLVADEELPPSCVSVPLQHEGNIFGCLTFFGKAGSSEHRNFDEEDREFFEGMANLVAAALVQSKHALRMGALITENDKKLKELSLLYRVSKAMHATTRINKLIHLNLSALVSGESHLFERAMLFLINKRSGIMQGMLGISGKEHRAISDSSHSREASLYNPWELTDEDMERLQNSRLSRTLKKIRLPLDKTDNIVSRAVLEKKLLVISDGAKNAAVTDQLVGKFKLKSFASVPIIAKGEAVALLIVDNSSSGKTITSDDLRFLQLFANQAGMAIENSMLYNRLEDANREFLEIRERLVQGERLAALGETTASVAHELKTPLISIGGLARRLLRKASPRSVEWEYADTIVREADRLGKMLTEILFFTKKATICYSRCALREIIEESLAVVSGFLDENGIRVRTRISRGALEFMGDFQQIKQVCINLFLNAGEAMKQNGNLFLSAAPTFLNGREAVLLKVRDNGPGIPPEVLSEIFNPFFTTKEGGTGLGLPIAHRIVTNHGGSFQVENRAEGGVEFRVLLPIRPQIPSFQQETNPV